MPYTQEDLEQTGKWLVDARFFKGPKVLQRPDPLAAETHREGAVDC